MAWSQGYIDALKNPQITPIYQLKFIWTGPNGLNSGTTRIGSYDSLSSVPLKIMNAGVKINGASVIPQRWTCSFGSFVVPCVGDLAGFYALFPRGSFAELLVDIGTGFQRVACGSLKNIKCERPVYYFQFDDFISSLQSTADVRANVAASADNRIRQNCIMFRGLGIEDTLSADFTIGDTSLQVSTTDLYALETGTTGIVHCVDTTTSADFFADWTGKNASGHLTKGSAIGAVYPTTGNFGNLTAANAKIKSAALLYGHPTEILGRILLSTGTGQNGSFDVYPENWSAGAIFDSSIFDNLDCEAVGRYVITLANQVNLYRWNLFVSSEFSSGLRTFCDFASKCGQWPIWRQNAVTYRSSVDPELDSIFNYAINIFKIDDTQIVKLKSHDVYNPQCPSIYTFSKMIHSFDQYGNTYDFSIGAMTNSRITSIPTQSGITRDNQKTYSGNSWSAAGRVDNQKHATADLNRMHVFDAYTHEKISMQTTIDCAVLCAGDVVEITSSLISGLSEDIGKTFQNRRGLVLSVSYSFDTATCDITVAVVPPKNKR